MRTKVSTYDRVLKLLTENEKYRNSDNALWLRILDDLGLIIWSTKTESYWVAVDNLRKSKNYETIRRSRQMVQSNHPELRATDPKVLKLRRQKEATKGTFVYRESYNPALDRPSL